MSTLQGSGNVTASVARYGAIRRAVVELDIEIGAVLAKGKVVAPVHRDVYTLSSPAKIAAVPSP